MLLIQILAVLGGFAEDEETWRVGARWGLGLPLGLGGWGHKVLPETLEIDPKIT